MPPQHLDGASLRSNADQHLRSLGYQRSSLRLIVADSEAIFRVGMGKIFALEKDLEVVAQTENLQQTLAQFPVRLPM